MINVLNDKGVSHEDNTASFEDFNRLGAEDTARYEEEDLLDPNDDLPLGASASTVNKAQRLSFDLNLNTIYEAHDRSEGKDASEPEREILEDMLIHQYLMEKEAEHRVNQGTNPTQVYHSELGIYQDQQLRHDFTEILDLVGEEDEQLTEAPDGYTGVHAADLTEYPSRANIFAESPVRLHIPPMLPNLEAIRQNLRAESDPEDETQNTEVPDVK